jgi:hypothetical protein
LLIKNLIAAYSAYGIYLLASSNLKFTNFQIFNCVTGGIYSTSYNSYFYDASIYSNPVAITSSGDNVFFDNIHTWLNTSPITSANFMYLNNSKIDEATEFSSFSVNTAYRIFSQNHDGVYNNNYIFADGGNIITDTSVYHGTSGISWRINVISNTRTITYPLELNVAKLALKANTPTTVKAWFKQSDTSIRGVLYCKNNPYLGVIDLSTYTVLGNTNWQELSLIVSTNKDGVVEIYAGAYYVSSLSSNVRVSDMTII